MINYGRGEYIMPSALERNFLSEELKAYCKSENICCDYFCSILKKIFKK